MPLRNRHARVAEEDRDALDRRAGDQELDGEGIAEPVRVSAFDAGELEHFRKGVSRFFSMRFDRSIPAPKPTIRTQPRSARELGDDERRKRHENGLAGFLRVQKKFSIDQAIGAA